MTDDNRCYPGPEKPSCSLAERTRIPAVLLFGLVGFGFIGVGLRSILRSRKLKRRRFQLPDEPWSLDDWDPERAPDILKADLTPFAWAVGLLLWTIAWAVGYPALNRDDPLLASYLIVLIPALFVAVGYAMFVFGRRVKYADGRLLLRDFPCFVRNPIRLTLRVPKALRNRTNELSCTLRLATQTIEGGGEAAELVTREFFRQDRRFGREEINAEIPLEFELPSDAPATELCGDTVRFYELEVRAESTNIDYRAIYLLPVYR